MTPRDPLALTLEVLRDWRSLTAGILLFIVLPVFAFLMFGDR